MSLCCQASFFSFSDERSAGLHENFGSPLGFEFSTVYGVIPLSLRPCVGISASSIVLNNLPASLQLVPSQPWEATFLGVTLPGAYLPSTKWDFSTFKSGGAILDQVKGVIGFGVSRYLTVQPNSQCSSAPWTCKDGSMPYFGAKK
jgi:hypothetical protein